MQGRRVLERLREEAHSLWISRRGRLALGGILLLVLCSLGAGGTAWHQQRQAQVELEVEEGEIEMEVDARGDFEPPRPPKPPQPQPPVSRQAKAALVKPASRPREVTAAWYDVPDDSLAARRAGAQELTAAHNRLPIGTLLRVTHLANGKSILVRITDRGIRDKKVKLDVCREAAEELGMVRKGLARVKMEIVHEDSRGASFSESQTASPVR